jgi:hypothetical protein
MKKSYAMLFAVVLGVGACNDGTPVNESSEQLEEGELGNLSLNLTGSDTAGRQYRLRGAQFSIWGYPDLPQPVSDGGFGGYSTTVTTETDPNAAVITLRVVPGYYQVNLDSTSWYLERLTDMTWERVEQVALLSPAYQSVYVYNAGVSSVNYRFGVDGELIDFRAGDLQIGIEIEQPGEGPGDAGFPFPGLFGGVGGLVGGGPGGGFGGIVDAGVAL